MDRILVIENTTGSVEHYYHFFFAALVPLLDQARQGRLTGTSCIRACGPMDTHLQALETAGLANFHTVDRRAIKLLCQQVAVSKQVHLHSEECYDRAGVRADGYRPDVLQGVAEFGISTFAPQSNEIDVLVIDRGDPDPFYLSSKSAIPGSANTRRSIPNLPEVVEALTTSGRDVQRVQLEQATLAQQIALFASANTIVAQHGAALSNVMWMKAGSKVVEIIPASQGRRAHFSLLADVVGAEYAALDQADVHSPVDPDQILRAINA